MGDRAIANQHSEEFRANCSSLGISERNPVYHHCRKNFLERTTATNLDAATLLRLSLSRHDLCRLDLELTTREPVTFGALLLP